jgi:hypothetical protein
VNVLVVQVRLDQSRVSTLHISFDIVRVSRNDRMGGESRRDLRMVIVVEV